MNAHARQMRQKEGEGENDTAHVNAVEEDGDKHLTARAEGEVGRMGKGVQRHENTRDDDHEGGDLPCGGGRVVKKGEDEGGADQNAHQAHGAQDGEDDHLAIGVLCLLDFACAELIADDDRNGGAERHIDDREEVDNGGVDVLCGDGVKTAGRIALVAHRDGDSPEKFVQHEGKPLQRDLLCKVRGDLQGAEGTLGKGALFRMRMRIDRQDGKLHIAGEHRGDGGTAHAEGGRTERPEDQKRIENEIDGNGNNARDHGHEVLSRLAHGRGVYLCQGEGDQTDHHDRQIIHAEAKRRNEVALGTALMQEETDQPLAEDEKDADAEHADQKVD